MTTTKAWAFYRRSTNMQELSIEDQRQACHAYAQQQGWSIVKEIIPEKGYRSGMTIDRDANFQEMILSAERGGHGAAYLVVYDVSRFGRLVAEEKIFWEQRFKRAGLRLAYVKDDFKNDDSIGDTLAKVLKHAEANEFSKKLSQTTKRGCMSHARLGRSCGGAAPYGYDRKLVDASGAGDKVLGKGERKANKLEHVVWTPGSPEKQEIVRAMFAAYVRGQGLRQIVDGLNGSGIASPRGRHWAKNQVLNILRNPAYVGTRIYNRHKYHGLETGEKKIRSREEWIIAENAHPAIVPRELFEQAQAKARTHRPRDGRHLDSPYLLSGIIRCARCGNRFYGQSKYHEKKKVPYYLCGGYHNKGKHVCESLSVSASVLEDYATREIVARLAELKDSKTLKNRLQGFLEAFSTPEGAKPGAGLEEALERKEGEIRNIVDALRQRGTSSYLLAELDRLEADKRTMQGQLAQLAPAPTATLDMKTVAAELASYLGEAEVVLAEGTAVERKAILREFVDKIEVSPQEREARFTFTELPYLQKTIAGSTGAGDAFTSYRRDRCGGWI